MRLIKIKTVRINLTRRDEKLRTSLDIRLYVYFFTSYLFVDKWHDFNRNVFCKIWKHDLKYFHFPVFDAIYENASKVSITELFRCRFLSGDVCRIYIGPTRP